MASPPRIKQEHLTPILKQEDQVRFMKSESIDFKFETNQFDNYDWFGGDIDQKAFNAWQDETSDPKEPVFNLPTPVPATNENFRLPSPIHVPSLKENVWAPAPTATTVAKKRVREQTSNELAPKRTRTLMEIYNESLNSNSPKAVKSEDWLDKPNYNLKSLGNPLDKTKVTNNTGPKARPKKDSNTTRNGYMDTGIHTIQTQSKLSMDLKRTSRETSNEPAPKRTRTLMDIYAECPNSDSPRAVKSEKWLDKANHYMKSSADPLYKTKSTNHTRPNTRPTKHSNASVQKVLNDCDLKAIFKKRALLASDRHPLDLKYPKKEVRQRYRDPNFYAFVPDISRHPLEQHWKFLEKPERCRHRSSWPILTITSCSNCGMHHKGSEDCAILRYHKGLNLFERDRSILEQFPCAYCDSLTHTTHVCFTMHAYCYTCKVRGHRPFVKIGKKITMPSKTKGQLGGRHCQISPELFRKYKYKFERLSVHGLYTQKASTVSPHWGFKVEESHLCNKTDWSDSEDEGNETVSVSSMKKAKGFMKQFGKICRHRSSNVILTLNSCAKCGLSHKNAQDCAFSYQVEGLFESDCQILKPPSCAYCKRRDHTTHMCDVMHAYCRTCKCRGHRPFDKKGKMLSKRLNQGRNGENCQITPELLKEYKKRFNQLSSKGIHSKKNRGKEVHRWGLYVPEDHICSESHWSDTEDEC